MRFGELGKAVPGLSDRLLSQRLRELEEEGLVEREVEAGTPVRVTYSLTEKGGDLGPAISRAPQPGRGAGSSTGVAAAWQPARAERAGAARAVRRSAATRASCRRRCASGRGCS